MVRRVGGRRVGAPKRRMGRKMRLMRGVRRRLVNPQPTFTETYASPFINANAGGVFAARISDIPQINQYNTLYRQYRINWIKVMLLPAYGYSGSDANAALYNNSVGVPYVGAPRITFAINDSPGVVAPANEAQVLEDNGAKIQMIVNKWSKSFKPVPDVQQTSTGGGLVYSKQKYKQWFNFITDLVGNNPLHYGISYWITQPTAPGATGNFQVFYKVNFSLRDPQ